VAKKLVDHPGQVPAIAAGNLAKIRRGVQGRSAESLVNEWTSLVTERNLAGLITVLLGTDHRSIDMRQVSPFVGMLSQEERVEAIGRAM
jgi:hypothetical protein